MRNFNISIIALLESHHKSRRNILQILSSAIVSGHFSGDPFVSSKLLLHSHSDADDDDDDEAAFAFSKALFFHIQNPNIFAWNFIFKAYSRSSSPQESLSLTISCDVAILLCFPTAILSLSYSKLVGDEIIVSGKLSTENPHGMQVSLVENGIMITPVETMVQLWSKALELKGIAKFGYGLGLQKFVILSAQVRLDWLAIWDD
ncbi:hypothetical protein FEM48_Zijuj07G0108800 [Ziziphus jujuba var. spinosa]|uniref:Uncharacterized protein n=1 Tax=Ziziphus jujuba var. spinosa TaxID=714518 RepID=A0A978V477_ZIZJJ|nr:hypothetical protein FEM48_Zijuj07G0108800 [Ziziphus jujuba var. spinosa]